MNGLIFSIFLKKNKKPYISYFLEFHKTIIFNEYPYSQNSYSFMNNTSTNIGY